MFGISIGAYLAFLVAMLVITVVPGPDQVYLSAVALRDGRRAGVVASAGIAAAMSVHTLVAVTGIGAALAAVPAALDVIRVAGAAYLIYLGISTLRKRSAQVSEEPAPSGHVFSRALIVNLTNPKIVLFYLAFLPQFVSPTAGSVPLQMLVLGATFVVIGFLFDAAYSQVGAAIGQLLVGRGNRPVMLATISGVVYLALGVIVMATMVPGVANLLEH